MPIRTVSGSTQPTAAEVARARTWANLPPEVRADPKVRAKYVGLGDVVAAVARPIARMLGIDPGCKTCADRQKLLNDKLPRLIRRRSSP